MTYDLYIGDYAYSSWSLRGWLLFRRFSIPCSVHMVPFSGKQSVAELMAVHAPARTVPTMVTSGGAVVSESLAIAEELASRHPDAGHWPADPDARAIARTLAAEMHSGFSALRQECPMALRVAYKSAPVSEDVHADLRRLEAIWDAARNFTKPDGPWLCGGYSAADAFFAPVAARIAGYGLEVSENARAYVEAHLADPAFRRWRAMGLVRGETLPWYVRDYPQTEWPGPSPHPATPIDEGPSENATCPYSGDPVTHFMEIDGRIFGFCNAFCRDKTVVDPMAWDDFVTIYQQS